MCVESSIAAFIVRKMVPDVHVSLHIGRASRHAKEHSLPNTRSEMLLVSALRIRLLLPRREIAAKLHNHAAHPLLLRHDDAADSRFLQ